jgi:hypothetical protein
MLTIICYLLSLHALIIMISYLVSEAPLNFHKAFDEDDNNMKKHEKNFKYYFRKIRLIFCYTFSNFYITFYLIYAMIALMSIKEKFFGALLLIDIFKRNEMISDMISAIWTSRKKFLVAIIVLFVLEY